MQFKSLNICSHTLAAAHINDDVDGFHKKFGNRLPNLTQLASHGMPANARRKGGKAPRKKTAPRSVITSENRIPLLNNSTADNQNNFITVVFQVAFHDLIHHYHCFLSWNLAQ